MHPIPLEAGNPHPMTGRGNVTWLIDGAEPALVDAGVGNAPHLDAIAAALGGRPLAHVLVTHGHLDHVGGVPALRARWPSVRVWKCPAGAEDGVEPLRDGMRVRAGDTELVAVHTPGHAPDHMCFWHESSASVFGGDMVVRGSTVVIPANRGGSVRAYLASLERLLNLGPRRIYPGHGDVIDDPRELIRAYILHRLQRERQVRDCLAEGLRTPEEIAARVYPQLPDALRWAAEDTVRAHLHKIREDDRR